MQLKANEPVDDGRCLFFSPNRARAKHCNNHNKSGTATTQHTQYTIQQHNCNTVEASRIDDCSQSIRAIELGLLALVGSLLMT